MLDFFEELSIINYISKRKLNFFIFHFHLERVITDNNLKGEENNVYFIY